VAAGKPRPKFQRSFYLSSPILTCYIVPSSIKAIHDLTWGNSFTHLSHAFQFQQPHSRRAPPIRLKGDTLLYPGALFPVCKRYEAKKDQHSIATCLRLPFHLFPSYISEVSRHLCSQMALTLFGLTPVDLP